MFETSDRDDSDLDDLVLDAYNKLETNANKMQIDENDQLSLVVHNSTPDDLNYLIDRGGVEVQATTRSVSPKENVKKLSKPKLSSKLDCDLPSCDLKAMCNESLDQETSTSLLLQPGLAKMRTLPCEQSLRQTKRDRRKEKDLTKGSSWFNLPASEITEEKKNDLMVLQMRKVLDPKRFYKGSDLRGSLPKYFQMGTVVESPAEYYSSRIPNKGRKTTLVDELLNDSEFRRYNKKKYEEIQATEHLTRRSKAHQHMKRQKKNKK